MYLRSGKNIPDANGNYDPTDIVKYMINITKNNYENWDNTKKKYARYLAECMKDWEEPIDYEEFCEILPVAEVNDWWDEVEEFVNEGMTFTEVCIAYQKYDNVPTIWYKGCITNGKLYDHLKSLYNEWYEKQK